MTIGTWVNDNGELVIEIFAYQIYGYGTVYEDVDGGYFVSVICHGYYHVDTVIEAKRLVLKCTEEDTREFEEKYGSIDEELEYDFEEVAI